MIIYLALDVPSGVIREGESYLVGPLLDGTFLPAKVTTIHRYRVPRRIVYAGQAASLSLLHIGGSRLRKVSLHAFNPLKLLMNFLGHGPRLSLIESSSLCRIYR